MQNDPVGNKRLVFCYCNVVNPSTVADFYLIA